MWGFVITLFCLNWTLLKWQVLTYDKLPILYGLSSFFFLTFFLGKRTKSHITMALQGNIPNCCVSPLFFYFYHAAFLQKKWKIKMRKEIEPLSFHFSFQSLEEFERNFSMYFLLRLDSSGKLCLDISIGTM